ncbi:hypothetical protein PLCT1_02725 [Planctomycetaceae bacterium]|nr:hypothetical protein PLCT1_02725 [Planctomycetaceae bacterium]
MLLSFILGVSACSSPTPRDLDKDELVKDRAQNLEAPERPKLNPPPNAPATGPLTLEMCAQDLAAQAPLARLQAANQLKRAGAEGIAACLKVLGAGRAAVVARIFDFFASQDIDSLPAEAQADMRASAAKHLKSTEAPVRIAAAQMLASLGAGGVRTEFLSAITDTERKVRWAVVRRFSEYPDELQNAQLMLLVSFIADAKLDSATRGDAYTLLLAVFEKYSKGAKPEGYDPYADPKCQGAAVSAWENWARAVVITPLPR